MRIVIDIDPARQEFPYAERDLEAIVRRRFLSGPRTDLQFAGFTATVVGVVEEGHPGFLDPDKVEGPLYVSPLTEGQDAVRRSNEGW